MEQTKATKVVGGELSNQAPGREPRVESIFEADRAKIQELLTRMHHEGYRLVSTDARFMYFEDARTQPKPLRK